MAADSRVSAANFASCLALQQILHRVSPIGVEPQDNNFVYKVRRLSPRSTRRAWRINCFSLSLEPPDRPPLFSQEACRYRGAGGFKWKVYAAGTKVKPVSKSSLLDMQNACPARAPPEPRDEAPPPRSLRSGSLPWRTDGEPPHSRLRGFSSPLSLTSRQLVSYH